MPVDTARHGDAEIGGSLHGVLEVAHGEAWVDLEHGAELGCGAVVLPELVPRHWWENLLHNQTALFVKRLLLFEPNVVLTSVPFHLRHAEVKPPGPS